MGAVRCGAVLAVTVAVWFWSASANFFDPFIHPIFGNGCEENSSVCGKGKCLKSDNSSFGFICECEDGWRQARAGHEQFFAFLPCVVPNCTFNYTCSDDAAPAPTPASRKKPDFHIFDPCFWAHCGGGGSCNATSPFTHDCLCDEGYHNLFNSSAFPCYKDCSVGLDCARLGLNFTRGANSSNSDPSGDSVADETNSDGAVMSSGFDLGWLVFGMTIWTFVSTYS
ncbi:uncharacterized protein LOC127250038 [Andrographis paniculata]|uniref:uncharacterized protein LOC127250038 n=1 Tax=Andrographis paniculata TaxID=175694 RepID=UPI0021E7E910|nr:uncharacterized protein LOC127250038 [Andrographis paniculata]